jgi:hypothetical protein
MRSVEYVAYYFYYFERCIAGIPLGGFSIVRADAGVKFFTNFKTIFLRRTEILSYHRNRKLRDFCVLSPATQGFTAWAAVVVWEELLLRLSWRTSGFLALECWLQDA